MPQLNDPEKITPLLVILRSCSPEQRTELAELAGTTEAYLYSMAGLQREPLTTRALRVATATRIMNERSKGSIPEITVEQIGEMFRK